MGLIVTSRRWRPLVLAAAVLLAPVLMPGCAAPPKPPPIPTFENSSVHYIDPDVLRALAESLPKPPESGSAFEKALTDDIKSLAATTPPLAAEAKDTDPADSDYRKYGFDMLGVIDASLAFSGSTLSDEQKAAACRGAHPATCRLLQVAGGDLGRANYKVYARQRPDASDNRSYPSGHATRAAFQCRLLAAVVEAMPNSDHRRAAQAALLREAWVRGLDRLALGVHFPSDVTAGFVFGQLAAQKIIETNSKPFHEDFNTARREWGTRTP